MRIAYTGAQKVGKTTLAEEITADFSGHQLRSEPYLQLEEEGYPFADIPHPEDYIMQFYDALEQIGNSDVDVIFDRCPLDILAYIHKCVHSEYLYNRFIKNKMFLPLRTRIPIPNIIC